MKKKNSNVQVITRKKKKFHNREIRIKNIYKIFKKILFSQIKNENFCIGVSGGPDSLALSYLSKLYAKEFNSSFKALIVNHRLRRESTKEANKVKFILSKEKIPSKILNWNGKIPKSNIQSHARKIRYNLLNKECKNLGIRNLILGHHSDDFIETFFIRLFRGSGLKGLSSFNIVSFQNKNNLKTIRPLINIKKNDLIDISNKIFGTYISDPANFEEKYLRTRIRNYIDSFKSDGLDINKVKLTIKNLQIANRSLDYYFKRSNLKYIRRLNDKKYLLSNELFFNETDEIIFRTIGTLISKIGEKYYMPRGKDLKNLVKKMQLYSFNKSTLGGCIIEKLNNSFIIQKERQTG